MGLGAFSFVAVAVFKTRYKKIKWLSAGIDDMFVIVQTWKNEGRDKADDDIAEKMGKTMEKAGVAITVTSLTDVLAFVVGGTTVRSRLLLQLQYLKSSLFRRFPP